MILIDFCHCGTYFPPPYFTNVVTIFIFVSKLAFLREGLNARYFMVNSYSFRREKAEFTFQPYVGFVRIQNAARASIASLTPRGSEEKRSFAFSHSVTSAPLGSINRQEGEEEMSLFSNTNTNSHKHDDGEIAVRKT